MTPAKPGNDAGPQHSLITDLEQPCDPCDGTGLLRNPAWYAWRQRLRQLEDDAREARQQAGLPPDLPATGLSVVVSLHGEPSSRPPDDVPPAVAAAEKALDNHHYDRPPTPERETCPLCRGYGKVLSEVGKKFAALLQRHGFLRSHLPIDDPPPGRSLLYEDDEPGTGTYG
ncbi:hypothetical protein [Spongiactinospora sp. TRM90649]|uniref:hypothetical protein n=1 Tax=Spongiactinospora sp. TRM90649 TaxID=3031114 RepID=UPI0023F9155F|nr:hypothetical protein [Spongiactinospora sp. TRM90649]MDF5755835.1 hypothetical protein [Spongiactinospora sp. TRM90649]